MSRTAEPPSVPQFSRQGPTPRSSRVMWFLAGAAAAACMLALFGVAVVIMLMARPSATPADMARIVARPLIPEGSTISAPTEATMRAGLSSRLAEANRIAAGREPLASVAREYKATIAEFQNLIDEQPTSEPLIRAGLDTWRGSVNDDDREFVGGLIGVASELSRYSDFERKASSIHAKIIATRLRVAELASKHARPEATTNTAEAVFSESRGLGTVENDTLAMRNISGQRLTNVMVVTELTGRSGEQFANLYFAERWEPNQVVLAVCPSNRRGRETVHDVVLVRFRILSDQRTSRLFEMKVGP